MKRRNLILIICLMVLVFVVVGVIAVKLLNSDKENNNFIENNNGIIENTNKDVISDKEVSNILFSDIKYTYDGVRTRVTLTITNNNDKSVLIGDFIVKVYDKNNNYIDEFTPSVSYVLPKNESGDIGFSIKEDLIEVYKLEIELPNLEFVEISENVEVE